MEPSPAKGKAQGRLLVSTSLDSKDELEEVGIDSFPSAVNIHVRASVTAHICEEKNMGKTKNNNKRTSRMEKLTLSDL